MSFFKTPKIYEIEEHLNKFYKAINQKRAQWGGNNKQAKIITQNKRLIRFPSWCWKINKTACSQIAADIAVPKHDTKCGKFTLPSHKFLLWGDDAKCRWQMQTERMGDHTCHVHEGRGEERGFARGLWVRGEDGYAGRELVENLQASRYTSVRSQRLANVVFVQRQENGNVRL